MKECTRKNFEINPHAILCAGAFPFWTTLSASCNAAREDFPQGRNTYNQDRGIMKLDTIKKLYVEELRDVYSAEQQLLEALPKMATGSSSDELKQAFEDHLEETKGHVERLEEIFETLDEKPAGKTCKAMKGLIEEGSEILDAKGEDSVLDAGIIAAAQKVEHYEMATYGTLRTWAELLNEDEAASLLQETLDEEGRADKTLNELATEVINPEALLEGEVEIAASSRR
jgi:ferritin-like metal-binding protein YciE